MHLAILITGVLSFFWRHGNLFTLAVKPGFLDFDNLPDTNFSCENKVIGGYYADVETGCQMFHVCTLGQKGEVTDIKFLCLNGTVFDQETRVCERLDEVDCSKSESYFDLNLELYGNNAGGGFGIEPENESPSSSDKEEDEECEDEDEECKGENEKDEFLDEYEDSTLPPTTTTTTTTTTTPRTTTARVVYTTRPAFHSPPKITPPPTIQYPPNPPQSTQYNPNYPPQNIQYPPSSPETIAALLALHNAFQESLKNHDTVKHPSPSQPPTSPPSPPRQLNSNSQTPKQKDAQNRPIQSSSARFPAPLYNASPKPSGFTVNNYHPQSQTNTNSQFPSNSNAKQPQFHFESTSVSKPSYVHSTVVSERFGTPNFHHGFHINNPSGSNPSRHQFSSFQQPSLRFYEGNKPHPTSLAGGALPKPFSYPQIPNNNQELNLPPNERKPVNSSPLRLRQSEDISESGQEGDDILEEEIANGQKSLETHSSFVRAIPESPKQARKVIYPSLTTPAISVVLTTSSISSSRAQSVNVKNAPSAILKTPLQNQGQSQSQPQPLHPIIKEKPFVPKQNTTVSVRSEKPKSNRHPSFSQYQDEHTNYDTFFTDVSKIRNKRSDHSQSFPNNSSLNSTVSFEVLEVRESIPFKKIDRVEMNLEDLNCSPNVTLMEGSKEIAQNICINNTHLKNGEINLGQVHNSTQILDKVNIILKKKKRKTHSKTSLKNFHNVDFELLPSMSTVMKPINFKVKKKL